MSNHDYLNKIDVDAIIGKKENLPDGTYIGDIDGMDYPIKDGIEKLTFKLCITSEKGKGRFVWANYIIPKIDDQYFELRSAELVKIMKIIHPNEKQLGKWIDNKDYQQLLDKSVEFTLKTSKSGYQSCIITKLIEEENKTPEIDLDPFA